MNNIITGDSLEVLKTLEENSVDAVVTDPPYGLSFMGKKWDYDVPSTELWAECLRVLKPGGYLLAFAGTRTQHRMAVRIEDAGFEIRDMIAWVYGSGFPKSLNIGKAVDKLQGNEREVSRVRTDGSGNANSENNMYDDDHKFVATKVFNETKGTSEWEGWGTALKPALEPISVCRKPLEKGLTVAENVLKWGTGGIDIDGSRVEGENTRLNGRSKESDENNGIFTGYGSQEKGEKNYGRFPANLIHDGSDEVVGLFPNTKSVKRYAKWNKDTEHTNTYTPVKSDYRDDNTYGDSGSASRFFYCAKASKAERNRGCEGLEEKLAHDADWAGFGSKSTPRTNNHPTVKPIALMEYLVKLVSRENAVVLDPFLGSGTTAIACKNTNRQYIGIERDLEYVKIAEARIKTVENTPEPTNQRVE